MDKTPTQLQSYENYLKDLKNPNYIKQKGVSITKNKVKREIKRVEQTIKQIKDPKSRYNTK